MTRYRNYGFIEWIKSLFCNHKYESGDLSSMSEVNGWRKKCGKMKTY